MAYAIVVGNRVSQIVDTEIDFPSGSNVLCVSIPKGTTVAENCIYSKDSSGNVSFAPPKLHLPEIPKPTLKDYAQSALNEARVYVQNNFILLGETPSQPWIDYQKALIAIVNGSDTTSTTLPTKPA